MAQVKTKSEVLPKSPPAATSEPVSQVSSPPPKPASNFYHYAVPAIALIFLLANVALFTYLQISMKQGTQKVAVVPPTPEPTKAPTPTLTPTPYPLPQGKKTLTTSFGPEYKGPRITSTTIDPYDPKIDESQTYTVEISYAQPVTSVDLKLITDNKTSTYPLQKITSTATGSTWTVKITTDDTHLYTYYPNFTAKTATEHSDLGLTLRAY